MDKIIVPYHISRKFISEHKQWNFVYGTDLNRKGCFGQAWACVGEPNCYPVTTILKICPSGITRFSDELYREGAEIIMRDIDGIPRDKPIVLFKKIGEGYSQMNRYSPKLHKYLMEQLFLIAYPNQEIDYKGTTYPLYNQPQ